MQLSPRPSRMPSKLSDSLHHQLTMYAFAASAAGVSVVALGHSADARVIYTPAHRYLPLNRELGIDFAHDGRVDFYLFRKSSGQTVTTGGTRGFVTAVVAIGAKAEFGGVAGYRPGGGCPSCVAASALRAGQIIKPGLGFYSDAFMALKALCTQHCTQTTARCSGKWNNVKNRYLGLEFNDSLGEVHYGWARLNERCNKKGNRGTGAETLLTGYAYETVPNRPIIAGETQGPDVVTAQPDTARGSLGRLALGRK